MGGKNISGSALNLTVPLGSGQVRRSRVRASILNPCRPLDVRSVIRFATAKHTVIHLNHFNVSIMTQVRYNALLIR